MNALAVAKLNFKKVKLSYFIFLALIGLQLISYIINNLFNTSNEGGFSLSFGFYSYFIILISAILIPARNFRKLMNFNVKKLDYTRGVVINYVIFSFIISLFTAFCYFYLDKSLPVGTNGVVANPFTVFGWNNNGAIVAFIRHFVFLFMVALIVHTLTTIQGTWYGWLTNILIVAVISVFTPIASLRKVLVSIFDTLIFTPNAVIQILGCLGVSVVVYILCVLAVSRKRI
ncbi:permease [Brevibacillus brevis]|uniref:Permease n=1 Tax=Brevibacillus brevis TaxID=1393 RepID=A0A517I4Z6_BREBE|nr:permease [Brevibacillus brevis]QDS33967.1 permease [Brevibacillus brevis]